MLGETIGVEEYERMVARMEEAMAQMSRLLHHPLRVRIDSEDAEERVVGAMLADGMELEAYSTPILMEMLPLESYSIPFYAAMAWACSLCYIEQGLVEFHRVWQLFGSVWTEINGAVYDGIDRSMNSRLINARLLPGQEGYFAGQVREAAHLRRIVHAAALVQEACHDPQLTYAEKITSATTIMRRALKGEEV